MTLSLHPATTLPAMYELLRTIEPAFRILPDSDDIEFRTVRMRDYGDCDGNVIRVSRNKNGHLGTLAATVAHEMIHVWQVKRGIAIGHGPEFKRIAKSVCTKCGFDPRSFL